MKFVPMMVHPMLSAIITMAKKKRVHRDELKRDHQLKRARLGAGEVEV